MRATSPDHVGRAILFMLLSTMANSGMNATMKWCSATYASSEIAFFRQAFALVPVGLLIAFNGGFALLATKRPFEHLVRSAVGNLSLACIVVAYKYLPLSDVTAYNFTAPLFLTALSVPLLKEKVGLHRWGAVLVGFVGVLIIMRPGGAMSIGVGYAVLAAVAAALAMIAIRQLGRTEAALTIVFYFTLFGIVADGLVAIPSFRMPRDTGDWGLLALAGIFGGLAQYCTTMSLRFASPPRVAPYNYATLLWTVALQFFIWRTLPDRATLIGACFIVASGLYIIYREARQKVSVTSATTPQEAGD